MYIFNLHIAEESKDNIWEKFELEWLLYTLVIFIYFKIQSYLQKEGLWMPVHQKKPKIFNITVATMLTIGPSWF